MTRDQSVNKHLVLILISLIPQEKCYDIEVGICQLIKVADRKVALQWYLHGIRQIAVKPIIRIWDWLRQFYLNLILQDETNILYFQLIQMNTLLVDIKPVKAICLEI
jgi:hypothetical protein